MTKKAKDWTQAPKKKPVRKRSMPVAALSDLERELRAVQAIAKAKVHLSEAEPMAEWGKAPNACIHSAYYAMHFIATAALFRAGGVGRLGSVPESHVHVMEHYLALAEKQPPPLNESARMLNRALNMRMESDYFADATAGIYGATATHAAEITADAKAFFAAWQKVWSP